jgi:hypothetical protein
MHVMYVNQIYSVFQVSWQGKTFAVSQPKTQQTYIHFSEEITATTAPRTTNQP